jgi:hypothetical protein
MSIVISLTSGVPDLYNYATLKTAIADWLHRSDLTTKIPDFIALAEAKLNRELRLENMVDQTTQTISAAEVGLAEDFLEAISLEVGGEPYEFRTRTQFFSLSGRYFTRRGDALLLAEDISADTEVVLTYYARIPSLTEMNDTNWLLNAAPDLYLYSALMEAVPLMNLGPEDMRPSQWATGRASIIAAMKAADDASRFSGQALTISAPR